MTFTDAMLSAFLFEALTLAWLVFAWKQGGRVQGTFNPRHAFFRITCTAIALWLIDAVLIALPIPSNAPPFAAPIPTVADQPVSGRLDL